MMTEREMYIDVRLYELRELLSNTDYIACKIAEGSAAKEEYADIIAQRQKWRNEINTLEAEYNAFVEKVKAEERSVT